MDKLQRQILGSTNWGSSVNANWGKIEEEFDTVQNKVDKLAKLLEKDFGVLFGGFLRFDVTNEAATIKNWTGSELEIAKFGDKEIFDGLVADSPTIVCVSQGVFTVSETIAQATKPEALPEDATDKQKEEYNTQLNNYNTLLSAIRSEKRQFYTIGSQGTMPINRVFRAVGNCVALEGIDPEEAKYNPYTTG